MALAAVEHPSASDTTEASAGLIIARLSGVVLVRLATAPQGLTEAELARDTHAVVAHRLAAREWQRTLGQIVVALKAARHATVVDQRLEVTANGRVAATAFLGLKKLAALGWLEVRDGPLVAVALGLEKEPAARLKGLRKLDGLRHLVVLSAFKLKIRGKPSASRLRGALALVALERAFGGQITHGLGEKPGLSAKSGRLLAGQLSVKPRDFGTDARLVAALAAEAVGAPRSDLASLRAAILRRFVSASTAGKPVRAPRPSRARQTRPEQTSAAVNVATASVLDMPDRGPREASTIRPDPAGFARDVRVVARARAEGWSGNRKALISRVWEALRARRPEWALTEIEYKCMLTEAHRCGLLMLASADLKDKRDLRELQHSAVSYKNTVWHFIRIED